MKKVFLALAGTLLLTVCAVGESSAQHYLGIRAGYGSGTARFYPQEDMGSIWGLYSGGISWKYYSSERIMGGVQIDLEYFERGYKIHERNMPDTTYSRKVQSVMMPFMLQPHFYLFKRNTRIFFNLGFTLSYNHAQREKYESKRDGVFYDRKYDMLVVRDNYFGYGLAGGGGINFIFNRFEFLFEARYHYGFADIMKNKTKYDANPRRSPLDNLNFSVGFYYRLSKHGILSPPGRRLAEKMRIQEQERVLNAPFIPLPEEDREPDSPTLTVPGGGTLINTNDTQNGNDQTTESSPSDTEGH